MAHIHEKIDFTSSVLIVQNNRVLLHFHKKTGQWLQPGGHVELDEDQLDAAHRETSEESGLRVRLIGGPQLPELADDPTDRLPPKFVNRHPFLSKPDHQHVDHVYFGRVTGGELKPEEGVEMRWFTAAEVADPALVMPRAVRAYALAALRELASAPIA